MPLRLRGKRYTFVEHPQPVINPISLTEAALDSFSESHVAYGALEACAVPLPEILYIPGSMAAFAVIRIA